MAEDTRSSEERVEENLPCASALLSPEERALVRTNSEASEYSRGIPSEDMSAKNPRAKITDAPGQTTPKDDEGLVDDEPIPVSPFERILLEYRKGIKHAASGVLQMRTDVSRGLHLAPTEDGRLQQQREDRSEMIANIMLAYRHLEDASMRLGKAIQAHNGGTSVYDRESTVGA